MLRYQINPHFLYNTLNLIASMGELSDFPEIVEITKNLSCIMQYNVKGSRFVSLKDGSGNGKGLSRNSENTFS